MPGVPPPPPTSQVLGARLEGLSLVWVATVHLLSRTKKATLYALLRCPRATSVVVEGLWPG